MSADSAPSIRAAGVVVFDSELTSESRRFLAIHRPHHGDWSLPKGKLEPDEAAPTAAVRECHEETGFTVRLGARLNDVSYLVRGRPKQVSYWVACITDDSGFSANSEVDERTWVPVTDAAAILTHAADVSVVAEASKVPSTRPLIILRHAEALSRTDFQGPDIDRPLTPRGHEQTQSVCDLLGAYGVEHVLTSPYLRCQQTVDSYADTAGIKVTVTSSLGEAGRQEPPATTQSLIESLASTPQAAALCTHRPVIPSIISELTAAGLLSQQQAADSQDLSAFLNPAEALIIHVSGSKTVATWSTERHDAP